MSSLSSANIAVLNPQDFLTRLQNRKHPAQKSYQAFYSSWIDGIVTDPAYMVIPMDDHLVHRGDGVFEALKWTGHKVYLFQQHVNRLRQSAERIALPVPWSDADIKTIVQATLEAAQKVYPYSGPRMVRLFVSRGPGQYSTNPYDSVGSQLQVVVTELKSPTAEVLQKGFRIGKSMVKPKSSDWAPYKTCNYLPNVMMKKESVDRGLDFVVGFNEDGFLTESSTENIIILSQRGELLKPTSMQILQGTTMNRLLELTHQKCHQGDAQKYKVQSAGEAPIDEKMILSAQAVMIVGTTWDLMPVCEYEGQKLDFKNKEAFQFLRQLLLDDQASN